MRALRLLRLGVAMSAIGGVALVFAAMTGRVAVPVGVTGAGLLLLLVIPLLLFLRMTILLRALNENRTLAAISQTGPPEEQKVVRNPS